MWGDEPPYRNFGATVPSGRVLHYSRTSRLTSAWGHKRIFAVQNGMSALPRKRTCAVQLVMSALCQKRTSVAIHRRSLGLLVKALTVLCHARSIDRKLCSLPHVEEIFCSLVVTRVNSCRPDRADLLRFRQRGKQKRREGEHRKTFLHGGSAFRKWTQTRATLPPNTCS